MIKTTNSTNEPNVNSIRVYAAPYTLNAGSIRVWTTPYRLNADST